jgi:hypothetical protein
VAQTVGRASRTCRAKAGAPRKWKLQPHISHSLAAAASLTNFPPHEQPLHYLEQAADTSFATMSDNEGPRGGRNSSNRGNDKKRKWADKDRRNASRGGGGRLQHGSRPNKKRNMGRKEHK